MLLSSLVRVFASSSFDEGRWKKEGKHYLPFISSPDLTPVYSDIQIFVRHALTLPRTHSRETVSLLLRVSSDVHQWLESSSLFSFIFFDSFSLLPYIVSAPTTKKQRTVLRLLSFHSLCLTFFSILSLKLRLLFSRFFALPLFVIIASREKNLSLLPFIPSL